MIHLEAPFNEEKVRALRVGDMVEISGVIHTGRDAVHKWLHEAKGEHVTLEGADLREKFRNGIIYHCGPVMLKKKGEWVSTAAGPTTSIREEPYQADIIERFGLRAIIGKGGMGEKTRQACQKFGCVYLHAVGGAAQVLAESIKKVQNVYGLEIFGSPEAIWELRVEHFPVVVTIDSHGQSLHQEIEKQSGTTLKELCGSKSSSS